MAASTRALTKHVHQKADGHADEPQQVTVCGGRGVPQLCAPHPEMSAGGDTPVRAATANPSLERERV